MTESVTEKLTERLTESVMENVTESVTEKFSDFHKTYICYISYIYLYCYMEQTVHNNYLIGLIFWKCWRVALKKFKFLMGIWIFQKRFQK